MIKLFFVALTGAAIAISAPVQAREPGGKPASAPAPASSDTVNSKTRYCVVEAITGSRIPIKTCKTRADWLADGFDPLKK